MPTQITFNQLMILGAIVGFVLGLVPLILGFTKKNLKFGLIGFALSLIAGTFFSFLGALPVSAVFTWIILQKKPAGAPLESVDQKVNESSAQSNENP